MQMQPDQESIYHISSFEDGQFVVNEQRFDRVILLTHLGIATEELPENFSLLKEENLLPLTKIELDVLVIGTGPDPELAPDWLYDWCQGRHWGLEVMPTIPACRTLNLLLADKRAVAGLLFNR